MFTIRIAELTAFAVHFLKEFDFVSEPGSTRTNAEGIVRVHDRTKGSDGPGSKRTPAQRTGVRTPRSLK